MATEVSLFVMDVAHSIPIIVLAEEELVPWVQAADVHAGWSSWAYVTVAKWAPSAKEIYGHRLLTNTYEDQILFMVSIINPNVWSKMEFMYPLMVIGYKQIDERLEVQLIVPFAQDKNFLQ